MTTSSTWGGLLSKRLAAFLLSIAATVAIALAIAPIPAFADEAVSFGGGDIKAEDTVYLGTWLDESVSWDVESASSGSLAVHSTKILFASPINWEVSVSAVPDLTLETSDLYTYVGWHDDLGFYSLPDFRAKAFADGERALTGSFTLPGDFGKALYLDTGANWYYWINEPLIKHEYEGNYTWWANEVNSDGDHDTTGAINSIGVRPATDFNLSSVLFASAAEGGKSGTASAGGFVVLSDASSITSWKFTVLDSSRSITASASSGTTVTAGYSSWTVPIAFSGGGTAENDYVSAIICDSDGNAVYYGTVAKATASGTQGMDMPTGLAAGTYTLKVFSEQRNGDKATDYASDFSEIELTVEAAEFTIAFVNDDGAELQSGKVAEGDTPTYEGAEPTKPATAQYTYTFKGWSPEITPATEDATYTATYDEAVNKYDLTFDLAGGTLDGKTGTVTKTYEYGEKIALPDAPSREGYTFKCWKGSEYAAGAEYTVEGDHEFTAEWEKDADPAPSKSDTSSKPAIPATGDSNGMLIIVLSVAALGSLCVLVGCASRHKAYRGKHAR